ncbi:ATP-binding protein [Oceanobacillus kimchii]|uniref:two-component system histidine kinase PnpS n=1 Tax=Oceanobacillus kimchii TaxID=746691 RepID=UPI0021A96F71|nr:ATP-binding protein [Oceanobacillus kimchii]MCT1575594.1 ATP-binding protein [Oceanobacillus kimchii]MCT2137225.1 ATP-binding protein [Oceanobacillus kimchii]
MKVIFSRTLLPSMIITILSLLLTGWLIVQAESNWIMVVAVLIVQFMIISILFIQFYNRYTRPIGKATKTVDRLIEGNYSARFYNGNSPEMEELSVKINTLARNMSEIAIQEQMQSEQLTTIVDNMQSGLVLIDEKGYVHVVNRKFLQMFGEEESNYRGHLYYDVFENENVHETVQKTFLYEEAVKESFVHRVGLNKIYVEVVGAPIFNERNMLKGAVLVLYDITELKKLENMRKDFVANVSHELRTPITSIRGFAETLLDNEIEDPATKEFMEIIYKESHRLQLLIEDLLALSRLEREDFRLLIDSYDVKKMVEEILPTLQQKAEKKNLTFNLEIPEQLTMRADKDRMKQVLINLVDNSIHYTPSEGDICLTISEEKDAIHFQVKDSGIGMDEKSQTRVFERFYRVDKARSRNTGGTGLGLAIVKHIVEVHKGKIDVESTLNEGTTIHIYIPK